MKFRLKWINNCLRRNKMSEQVNVVTFGKYRGKTVDEMLADKGYMQWLEAQPWFREKYGYLIVNYEKEEPGTPEHNRLQNLFLDAKFRENFWNTVHSKVDLNGFVNERISFFKKSIEKDNKKRSELIEIITNIENDVKCDLKDYTSEWYSKSNKRVECNKILEETEKEILEVEKWLYRFENQTPDPEFISSVKFEVKNRFNGRYVDVIFDWKFKIHSITHSKGTYFIEIKPTVADDYPNVLRQIKQMFESSRGYPTHFPDGVILFLQTYNGIGATKEQFIEIFKMNNIRIIFLDEIDDY